MEILKVRGIVIRETPYSECDKYIVLLAKGIGKISVFAKGACKINSPLLTATSIFCYADYVIVKRRTSYVLKSAEMIDSFYDIRRDILSLFYASYLVELTNKTLADETPEDEIMLLLLYALKYVNGSSEDRWIAYIVFEFKFLEYLGYSPYLEKCYVCHSYDIEYIDPNGVCCSKCKQGRYLPITQPALDALRYIQSKDVKHAFSFRLYGNHKKCLDDALQLMLTYHFNRTYPTYERLKKIICVSY
jgi:DNA repair protein RecO (recombination protein O)